MSLSLDSALTIPLFYARPSLHVEIFDELTIATWGREHDDESFFLEEARRVTGPILELACGTCRVALRLVDQGHEVFGLDASRPMLEKAREKKASLPDAAASRLHLHHGDMKEFSFPQRFELIYVPFRSFQVFLSPHEQRQCLQCARKHLAPGGRLIINLFDPRYEFLFPGKLPVAAPPDEVIHPVSGNLVQVDTLERENWPIEQTFQEWWRFTEINSEGQILRQEDELLKMRWTFRYEMMHLVENSGFTVLAEFSDFLRAPPAYGQEQIWILGSR